VAAIVLAAERAIILIGLMSNRAKRCMVILLTKPLTLFNDFPKKKLQAVRDKCVDRPKSGLFCFGMENSMSRL
jgi:hypothetical protein